MFELGCIKSIEWAVYQDWHSLLVEQFGHRVELEGIIYLRAPPRVRESEILCRIQEIQLISQSCIKQKVHLQHHFLASCELILIIFSVFHPSVASQTCMQRLEHRGRAEEMGVTLDYLDKLHIQHERWLVEKSTEWVRVRSRLCCLFFFTRFCPEYFLLKLKYNTTFEVYVHTWGALIIGRLLSIQAWCACVKQFEGFTFVMTCKLSNRNLVWCNVHI